MKYSMISNETSTAHNFNNSRPLYLNFSNITIFAKIFDSSETENVNNEKRATKKHTLFIFLKGLYFIMGGPR